MVAMPYFLVNIVFDIFSMVLFCTTSVALLSRSRFVGLWLPARFRERTTLALIVTQGLVLSVLSLVAWRVVARLRYVKIFSILLFDVLFFIGVLNSVVLAYQFLDQRCFLSMPKIRRRLLIALCSAVMTCVPLFAAVTAIVGLFVIK
jgi:hypothetical protein